MISPAAFFFVVVVVVVVVVVDIFIFQAVRGIKGKKIA